MNLRLQVAAVACVTALFGSFGLAGCGGGSSSSGSGGNGNSTATLTQAQTSLNNLISSNTNSQTGSVSAPSISSLQSVNSQFASAYQSNPTNANAQFGDGITTAALAGAEFANTVSPGVVPQAVSKSSAASSTRWTRAATLAQALEIWNLPAILSASPTVSLPKVTDYIALQPADLTPKASVNPAQVQTSLRTLDTQLATAESLLTPLANNASFSYTITNPRGTNPSTVLIGQVEVQVLLTFVNALRAFVNAALAYNADYTDGGTFNINAPIPSSFLTATQLTPDEYLPPSPFATLNSDGKSRLATTKAELNAGANNAVAAIQGYQNRNNANYLLNLGTVVTTGQLTNAVTQIQTYQAYLSNTESVTLNSGASTNVDVSAVLGNPPSDLRTLLPDLSVSQSGGQTTVLPDAVPDPTYGGLFSPGLPANTNLTPKPIDSSTTYYSLDTNI